MSKTKQIAILSHLTEDSSFHDITTQLSHIEGSSNTALSASQDVKNLSAEDQYMLVTSRVLTGNNVCTAIYKLNDNSYVAANNDTDSTAFFTKKELIKDLLQTDNGNINDKIDQVASNLVADGALVYVPLNGDGPDMDKIKADLRFLYDKRYSNKTQDFANAIKNDDGIRFTKGNRGIHAELQILPNILDDIFWNQTANRIITSKTMCAPCHLAIEATNHILQEANFPQINTVGTHGKTYPITDQFLPSPLYLGNQEISEKIKSDIKTHMLDTYNLAKPHEKDIKSIKWQPGERTKDISGDLTVYRSFGNTPQWLTKHDKEIVQQTSNIINTGTQIQNNLRQSNTLNYGNNKQKPQEEQWKEREEEIYPRIQLKAEEKKPDKKKSLSYPDIAREKNTTEQSTNNITIQGEPKQNNNIISNFSPSDRKKLESVKTVCDNNNMNMHTSSLNDDGKKKEQNSASKEDKKEKVKSAWDKPLYK